MEELIHDVIIVGAGPCGLAVAARLRERSPSALFTDDEHQRYHWIRRHSGRMAIKEWKRGKIQSCGKAIEQNCSTLVLDASGSTWLARWTRLFDLFGISHLRSPLFFHVDPRDRDSLLEFAHVHERQEECCEIGGCVGKEKSKHRKKQVQRKSKFSEPMVNERDRKDYFTPSSALFADQCCDLVEHYDLAKNLIRQESVQEIDYGEQEEEVGGEKLFTITTNKQKYKARVVVLAVGPGNAPTIPGLLATERIEGACHAMQIEKFPDASLKDKMKQRRSTNVLVVGGGLTSAQIADLALQRGVSKVWLMTRSRLKVKPFDLGLEWVGKYRNLEQAYFWSADSDEERWEQIQTARNGGSITPKFDKILKQHVLKGRLEIVTNTSLLSRAWDSSSETWTVETEPAVALPRIDYIYYATGVQTDVCSIPFLQKLRAKYPIKCHGGLPCITDDLQWTPEVPLFVAGKLGALKIGPGAANLAGARAGAERIAWSIAEILEKDDALINEVHRYQTGVGSRYDVLDTDGGEKST